jgi:hypothetical protein
MARSVDIFMTGLLLIVGISHVVRPRAWVEFFALLRDKGEAGAFIVAMLHLLPGLFVIALHPQWTGLGAIITFLGWAWTLKGAIYFIFPQFALRMFRFVSPQHSYRFVIGGWALLAVAGVMVWSLIRT